MWVLDHLQRDANIVHFPELKPQGLSGIQWAICWIHNRGSRPVSKHACVTVVSSMAMVQHLPATLTIRNYSFWEPDDVVAAGHVCPKNYQNFQLSLLKKTCPNSKLPRRVVSKARRLLLNSFAFLNGFDLRCLGSSNLVPFHEVQVVLMVLPCCVWVVWANMFLQDLLSNIVKIDMIYQSSCDHIIRHFSPAPDVFGQVRAPNQLTLFMQTLQLFTIIGISTAKEAIHFFRILSIDNTAW